MRAFVRAAAGKLTYANTMVTAAVFLALGGSARAVATVPRDSVVSKSIKNGELRSPPMALRLTSWLALCCGLALVASAPTAVASAPGTFEATTTEDFVFRGCEVPPSPTADLCGTVQTHGFGKGTVETVITGFTPLPSGCFSDQHTTTLFFRRDGDSLVLDIDGTLCPTGGPNFTFSGTYTVAGGTGDFAGATGSGSVTSARQDGPIATDLSGALQLDDD